MSYAIRLEAHGGPEVMQWVEVPRPEPQAQQILVRNHGIGLNFIDVYFRTGLYPHDLPHGLGLEGAGEVVAVGAEVSQFAVGDRVAYAGGLNAYSEYNAVDALTAVKL